MNRSLIYLGCLLNMVVLQAAPLTACGCGKKRHLVSEVVFKKNDLARGGCGCGGKGKKVNDEIPADTD